MPAPATAAEASNKQIYDRVGDASQGERIVSREEKPVEVKDNSRSPARVAFSGLPPSSGAQDTAMAPSPPLNTDPGGPASAEPKKIKTVTIRPDQTGGTGSTPAPRPNATPPAARARRRAGATSSSPSAVPVPPPAQPMPRCRLIRRWPAPMPRHGRHFLRRPLPMRRQPRPPGSRPCRRLRKRRPAPIRCRYRLSVARPKRRPPSVA